VRVLLVEDDPHDEELARSALRAQDAAGELAVAKDGAEALDFLWGRGTHSRRARAPLPDLVLLDLQLPKVHGLEVLRLLRADSRTANLPVVIMSASADEESIRAGYRFGANSFLRKPRDGSTYVDDMRALARYWLSMNRPPPGPPGAE
jgi:two-component system response regulator